MSNWEHANDQDLDAARDAYTLDDPKHPDYGGTMDAIEHVTALAKAGQPEYDDIILFTGNPNERMKQMQETAAILAEPVRQRHTVTIHGREHVRVEGWTMLGALLGVHPYLVWTRPSSHAEQPTAGKPESKPAPSTAAPSAQRRSRMPRHRSNWRNRDDYALRSMAQTRATVESPTATTRLRHHPRRLRPHTRRRNAPRPGLTVPSTHQTGPRRQR